LLYTYPPVFEKPFLLFELLLVDSKTSLFLPPEFLLASKDPATEAALVKAF
jgi:hypothetical protein